MTSTQQLTLISTGGTLAIPDTLRTRMAKTQERWQRALEIMDRTTTPTDAQIQTESDALETYRALCERHMICLEIDCYRPSEHAYCPDHQI